MEQYISKVFPDGASVDAALARAKAGGAIDITLQNKAPAGYGGFGEVQPIVDINNDEAAFNAAIDNLLSRMPNRSAMQICFANYPVYGNDGTIFSGTLYKSSLDYAVLHGTNYSGGSIQKAKGAGTWRPWEWVNPPMLLGYEYRTTERYLGKPVYAKAASVGDIAANTLVVANKFSNGGEAVVRCFAIAKYSDGIVTSPQNSLFSCVLVANGLIYTTSDNQVRVLIKADSNMTDCVAVAYYTKA